MNTAQTPRTIPRLAAGLVLAGMVVGLFLLLRFAAGPPSARGLPSLDWLRDGIHLRYFATDPVLRLLALLAWMLWAYATFVVVLRVLAILGSRREVAGAAPLLAFTNLVGLRPLRQLVDTAIGVTLLVGTVSGPTVQVALSPAQPVVQTIGGTTTSGSAWDRVPDLLAIASHLEPADGLQSVPAGGVRLAGAPDRSVPPTAESRVCVVKPGDSLWRIAERELGDPYRWRELFELNQGRRMADGDTLRRAGLIRPGWTLLLPGAPEGAVSPPAPPPTRPDDDIERPSTTATTAGLVPTDSSVPRSTAQGDQLTETPSVEEDPGTDPADRPVVSIRLPSGSVVGTSFAAGMLTALALSRLRSRRHRQPQPPEPGIRDHDPSLSDPVRWVQQLAEVTVEAPDSSADSGSSHRPLVPRIAPADPSSRAGRGLALGERDGRTVTVDLFEFGVVCLAGSGAEGVARATIAALLAAGEPNAVEVQLVGDQLLPDVDPFPGFRRHGGPAQAVAHLESEMVRRARMLERADADDLERYRQDPAAEPLPDLLLVCDQDAFGLQADRLRALADQGRGQGFVVLVLATEPLPGMATIEVETGGSFVTATAAALREQVDGARLFSLTPSDAVELLRVFAAARSSEPAPSPDASPSPASERPGAESAPTAEDAPTRPFEVPAAEGPPAPAAEERLVVQLLGAYRIHAKGTELSRGLRRKARELLAFYALHPDGAPLDVAAEALWPEADPRKAPQRFWTTLSNLRGIARDALGRDPDEEFELIGKVGDRYRLDPTVVDIDLWHFQRALREARDAADARVEMDALRRAADAYRGDLLVTSYYAWADAAREDLRRRVIDALARLAALYEEADDLPAAADALDQAIGIDPVAEELFRRLMQIQSGLNRPDAVRRTYQRLEASLAELEADPEDATERLFRELVGAPGASRNPTTKAKANQLG